MASSKYYFMGNHADTVYSGDKCIPVAPGDLITLSDADLKREENQYLTESDLLLAESEATKQNEAAAKEVAAAEEDVKEVEK